MLNAQTAHDPNQMLCNAAFSNNVAIAEQCLANSANSRSGSLDGCTHVTS